MDMQTIIKNSVGQKVTNKYTNETATITGVTDGENGFTVHVSSNDNICKLTFIQFVTNYHLDFTL